MKLKQSNMEDHIYKPEELLFALMTGYEQEGIPDCVAFTTKKCWSEDHCCSNDLGGHNMPGELLEQCGICEGELMESIFELTGAFTPKEVKEKLLAAGFTEDLDFTTFMKHKA